MANNNKKNKKLVSAADNGLTSSPAVAAPVESDEKTFDVDKFAAGMLTPHGTLATLQEQAAEIQELQFQLAQLKSINAGLEREVNAREEITVNLSREFKTVRNELANTRSELRDRQHETDFLQHALRESSDTVARLTEANERIRDESDQELAYYRTQLEEQSGLLASNTQDLKDLAEQVTRTERYADALRKKLQAHANAMPLASNLQRDITNAFDNAEERLLCLQEQLADEHRQKKQLMLQLHQLQQNYDRELRQIRFELGAAQDTISTQGSHNEKLVSDLVDNQGFRQALEAQLGEVEATNRQKVQKLERELQKARDEADEYDRKMRAKDRAIATLMSELANYSCDEEGADDADDEPQDVRPGPATQQARHGQRPRIARLLIGEAEGREIRFPLFKDRLTIGRTVNNDIQLNARYISRRHAVIVTDHGQTRLIDWGSRNGVFVNEKRIAEKFLASGDVVTIGTTKFRYVEKSKR